jgi:hypothetical protein
MAAAENEKHWEIFLRREILGSVEFQAIGLICDRKRLKNYS